jgi:superfamily II DNA helicase RecQ
VDNKAFIDAACIEKFRKEKLFLVVDEAHCIIDWGMTLTSATFSILPR